MPLRTNGGYWTLLQCVRDDPAPEVPDDGRFSADFRDFVRRCLAKEPAARATCDELLAHPFVTAPQHPPFAPGGGSGGGGGGGAGGGDEEDAFWDDDGDGFGFDGGLGGGEAAEVGEERAALRARAEDELAALVKATVRHVAQLVGRKRHAALAPLSEAAARAPDAAACLASLLDAAAARRPDCLERLSVQLNLPVEVVRRRFEAAVRGGDAGSSPDGGSPGASHPQLETAPSFATMDSRRDSLCDTLGSL